MTEDEVESLFHRLRTKNPNPRGELNYTNQYTLLVAVVLSALFKLADSPEKMLALGLDSLKEHVRTIGLFNTKSKNIMALSRLLLENFGSEVPEDRLALESLPGVGRKTANVVLNIAFGHPTCAVDTHIFRLSNRTGLAPGNTPLEVEKKLMEVIPEPYLKNAHHWLILHGRYVCKARKPDCTACVIESLCRYNAKATIQ